MKWVTKDGVNPKAGVIARDKRVALLREQSKARRPAAEGLDTAYDETQHMIRAVRAYQEDLYARQHRLWARFLLRRWWSWVNRTSEWWRRCNQRELEREWIYD